jgi:hypothetical protein
MRGCRRRLLVVFVLSPAFFAALVGALATQTQGASPESESLLLNAGLDEDDLAIFENWNGKLREGQGDVVARLLFRLQQPGGAAVAIDGSQIDLSADSGGTSNPKVGQPAFAEGRVVSVTPVDLPKPTRMVLDQVQLTRCAVELANGKQAAVLSLRVPNAWRERSPTYPYNEPVKLHGVVIGSVEMAEERRPLVLTDRLEWYPEADVSDGVAWLVQRGFDAALFDEVGHARPFAKPHEGLEARAFYDCLATVAESNPAEIAQRVRARLPAVAESAELVAKSAANKRRELNAELQATSDTEKKRQLQSELRDLRRQQGIAARVAERADRGVSSVWPMFLEPERNTGEFFLIAGTARRAIRIAAADSAPDDLAPAVSGLGQSTGLKEYYEVDVFTTDSQNQPVICCVARLPEGFPTGEVIREPVRVAGVFFKTWAYTRRAGATGAMENPMPARLAPPVVLAAAPEWLRVVEAPRSDGSWWGGMAIVGLIAMAWIILARVARRDRLARAQHARYDAPLEEVAGP